MSNADKPSEFLSIFNAANFFSDLAEYLTKSLAAKLYQRKDQMFLYATNFNPTFTGFVNMTNATSVKAPSVAHTVDDETVATTYYVGDRVEVELQNYTPTSVIQNTYAPKDNPTFTGTVIAPTPTTSTPTTLVATVGYVATYVTNALIPYLTQVDAASTYQTLADMVNYSTSTQIANTYLTITNAINTYAPLISPTFTGLVNMVGATSVTAPILSYVHPVSLSNDLVVTVGYLINYFTGELAIELSNYNTTVLQNTYAPINNPTFTGSVNAPTPSSSSSTLVATTQYVANELANYTTTSTINSTFAPLHSPSFTGAPTGTFPTKPIPGTAGYNQNELATLEYVNYIIQVHWFPNPTFGNNGGSINMSGASSILMGGSVDMATATSIVTSRTEATTDNSTKVATTAYVKNQGYATLASPTFTGTVSAPTQAITDNSTKVATTAYVQNQGYATLASPTFTGTVTIPTLIGTDATFSNGTVTMNGAVDIPGPVTMTGIVTVPTYQFPSWTSAPTRVPNVLYLRQRLQNYFIPMTLNFSNDRTPVANNTRGNAFVFTEGDGYSLYPETLVNRFNKLACFTFRVTAKVDGDFQTIGSVTNTTDYYWDENSLLTGILTIYPFRLPGGSTYGNHNPWSGDPPNATVRYAKNSGGRSGVLSSNYQWTDLRNGVMHFELIKEKNVNCIIKDLLYIYGITTGPVNSRYSHYFYFGCSNPENNDEFAYNINVELLSANNQAITNNCKVERWTPANGITYYGGAGNHNELPNKDNWQDVFSLDSFWT